MSQPLHQRAPRPPPLPTYPEAGSARAHQLAGDAREGALSDSAAGRTESKTKLSKSMSDSHTRARAQFFSLANWESARRPWPGARLQERWPGVLSLREGWRHPGPPQRSRAAGAARALPCNPGRLSVPLSRELLGWGGSVCDCRWAFLSSNFRGRPWVGLAQTLRRSLAKLPT